MECCWIGAPLSIPGAPNLISTSAAVVFVAAHLARFGPCLWALSTRTKAFKAIRASVVPIPEPSRDHYENRMLACSFTCGHNLMPAEDSGNPANFEHEAILPFLGNDNMVIFHPDMIQQAKVERLYFSLAKEAQDFEEFTSPQRKKQIIANLKRSVAKVLRTSDPGSSNYYMLGYFKPHEGVDIPNGLPSYRV